MKTKNTYAYLSLFLLASFTSKPSFAATTGAVTINGQVPAVCAVVVTPEAGSLNITDISLGDTNRLVATVNETCNDPNGYTMVIHGTNSNNHTGLFVDTVSAASHPFTITYNNVAAPVGGIVTNVNAAAINVNKAVRISYAANPALVPTVGFTYVEVLTFTIAGK